MANDTTSSGDGDERSETEGLPLPLPRWWKELAKRTCKGELGQHRLAEKLGCSQSLISQIFSTKEGSLKSSPFAAAISRELGIPLPAVVIDSQPAAELLARLVDAAVVLSEQDPETLAVEVQVFAHHAARSRQKPTK